MQVVKPANLVESVLITTVAESTSEAVMTQVGEKETGPRKGWQLSTRCPWAKEDPCFLRQSRCILSATALLARLTELRFL